MATIRKHRDKWQVQVRRKGYQAISKSFTAKGDALRWAREQERAADTGTTFAAAPESKAQTFFSELLDRYEAEVSSRKRSPSDPYHLRSIKAVVGQKLTNEIVPTHLAGFREERLRSVSPSTVRKEMTLFVTILTLANREWGATFSIEAFKAVRKPSANKGRQRRIGAPEWAPLHQALCGCRNPLIKMVFDFALATGMRRSEVLSLTWDNIDIENRIAHLPVTKNGEPRSVPLSSSARQVLLEVLKGPHQAYETIAKPSEQLVFPISANAVKLAWQRVRKKAGVNDLRFHDLRHEAISRFFELGLSVPEVALISGHKDARMLFRYTHLKAENVAQKLG